jgi:triacylglycerol lipase
MTRTGSIHERAEQMHQYLKEHLPKGTGVNFVAHSMGGLDVRYLISHIKPTSYTPLSLTSIGTPHRGSPFMDWCAANIGVGTNIATAKAIAATAMGASAAKALPFSLKAPLLSRPPSSKDEGGTVTAFTSALTSYLLNIFDSPAYSNLTTSYLRDFNPQCPDSPNVKYTSVAGRTRKMSVLHPLWFPKLVLDAAAENGHAEAEGFSGAEYEGNDGLVSVSSARWGEFIGAVDPCHHWDLRGEGGLWPQGPTLEKKPQGRPDSQAPGGWDWQGDLGDQLGLGLSASSTKAQQTQRDADKVEATIKSKSSSDSSSWDIAQVGQVLNWAMDLMPGGKGSETEKKNLANAKKEKEPAAEEDKSGFITTADGTKRRKDKFDLARFYGGLMLKLKDDGY